MTGHPAPSTPRIAGARGAAFSSRGGVRPLPHRGGLPPGRVGQRRPTAMAKGPGPAPSHPAARVVYHGGVGRARPGSASRLRDRLCSTRRPSGGTVRGPEWPESPGPDHVPADVDVQIDEVVDRCWRRPLGRQDGRWPRSTRRRATTPSRPSRASSAQRFVRGTERGAASPISSGATASGDVASPAVIAPGSSPWPEGHGRSPSATCAGSESYWPRGGCPAGSSRCTSRCCTPSSWRRCPSVGRRTTPSSSSRASRDDDPPVDEATAAALAAEFDRRVGPARQPHYRRRARCSLPPSRRAGRRRSGRRQPRGVARRSDAIPRRLDRRGGLDGRGGPGEGRMA